MFYPFTFFFIVLPTHCRIYKRHDEYTKISSLTIQNEVLYPSFLFFFLISATQSISFFFLRDNERFCWWYFFLVTTVLASVIDLNQNFPMDLCRALPLKNSRLLSWELTEYWRKLCPLMWNGYFAVASVVVALSDVRCGLSFAWVKGCVWLASIFFFILLFPRKQSFVINVLLSQNQFI